MITNFKKLNLFSKIFIRAQSSSHLYSLTSPKNTQTDPNDQTPQNPSEFQSNIQSLQNPFEFESKIQFLKKKLHPEALIKVLSSTNDLNASLKLFKWAALQTPFRHNIETYKYIILRLGMEKRVDEMEGYVNEMLKEGFLGCGDVLLEVVDRLVEVGKVSEGLRAFGVVNSRGFKMLVEDVNRLLGVVVEGKRGIKDVLFVYKEMVKGGLVPNVGTLNYLFMGLFDNDRGDLVLDQFKRMRKKGCCPNSKTYEIMVCGLVSKNFADEAFVVLNEVLENECDLEPEFFCKVLPLLFRMNRDDIGLRLFEKMKTLKVVPDLLVYEVLIQYYSKNLCIDDATNLVNEMISNDLKPPDCVFVDLVNGLCKLNKLGEAKQFLKDHQVMEANSYNELLKGYCEVGNFVEMIRLFQKMVESNIINSLTCNIMIRYLSENHKSNLVYKVLSRMLVSGSMPDSTTYSALIIGKCKSSELDDALSLFHLVCEEHWVIDSSCYATLIESLCQTERIQEAVEVFHYMSLNKCALSTSSFSMLIRGLCLIGKVDKVIKLLPLASYSGLDCSNEDYNTIMKGISTYYKGNGLLVIVARMLVEGCPLDSEAYNELLKSMIHDHRAKECALFLNQMIDKGLLPDTEILANSLSFLAQRCRLHTVLPTIHKLCSVSVSVSDQKVLNQAICNVLINGLWKEGYKHEARWLLDIMLEKGWVPDSITHRLLINSGDSEVSAYEKGDTHDEIASILSEGFGEL
ncbi:Pentatricopeptide repeat-containing protein [Artemisia annua]|uniref:Pentatricopeptide repeat-containing protein n=1 Tax=Artemisia annua TaxID=35608 RepID=A0A2U1PQB7_ARTAN|nr:Pentatricopeptide repeat-containing protein [Artemisia annua]